MILWNVRSAAITVMRVLLLATATPALGNVKRSAAGISGVGSSKVFTF